MQSWAAQSFRGRRRRDVKGHGFRQHVAAAIPWTGTPWPLQGGAALWPHSATGFQRFMSARESMRTLVTDTRTWWALVSTALLGLFGLALMMVPQADDWFFARLGRDLGTATATAWMYAHWQGLWGYNLLNIGSLEAFGPFWGVRVQAMLAIPIVISGVVAVLRVSYPQVAMRHLILAGGGVSALAIVASAANEGIYWGATVANYSLGAAVCMHAWAIGMDPAPLSWKRRAVIVVLAASIPSLSETMAVAAVGLLTLGAFLRPGRSCLPWAYMALGLAIGGITVVMAPGNAVRLQAAGGGATLLEGTTMAWNALITMPAIGWLVWAVAIALPYALALPLRRPPNLWRPCLASLILAATGWAAMIPAAIGTGDVTPHVWNVGWYATYAALLVTGITLGRLLACSTARWPTRIGWALLPIGLLIIAHELVAQETLSPSGCAALIIALTCLRAARDLLAGLILLAACIMLFGRLGPDALVSAPARYNAWIERDAILRAAGERGEAVAVVPRLPEDAYPSLSFFVDLTSNPSYSHSLNVAAWYKISLIWLDQRDQMPPRIRERWEAALATDVKRWNSTKRQIAPDHP